MKRRVKTLSRRKFLKTGILGGMTISVYPQGKLLNFQRLHSNPYRKTEVDVFKESDDRLLQIAGAYGSEFGEIKEMEYGCF
jgi:hypothetical protein